MCSERGLLNNLNSQRRPQKNCKGSTPSNAKVEGKLTGLEEGAGGGGERRVLAAAGRRPGGGDGERRVLAAAATTGRGGLAAVAVRAVARGGSTTRVENLGIE